MRKKNPSCAPRLVFSWACRFVYHHSRCVANYSAGTPRTCCNGSPLRNQIDQICCVAFLLISLFLFFPKMLRQFNPRYTHKF